MAGSENEQTSFGQLIADGALEIGDGYRAKNEELGGNGLIFLRAGHVTDTHIDFVGVERFHSELESRVRSKLSQAGDAVVTTKGNSTGRTAYVTASMPPFVYSPHLSYWRSKDRNRIEGGFLRYWSKSQEFVEQLAGMKASTDMAPYLSLIDQKRLKISLPPIHQQRRIAHILGTLDDKIELNRRMNETLEAMARALFKSWFVDFDPVRAKMAGRARQDGARSGQQRKPLNVASDLPWPEAQAGAGAEGDPSLPKDIADLFPDRLVESELGEIPEGWRIASLDSIADYLNGLALQKFPPEGETEFLPVIKIAQLRAGNTNGADKASTQIKPEYIIEDGDVLFSWSGSLEVEVWTGGRGALNQHLFKITSREVPKWFYYFATHLHLPNFRAIAAGKATTMGHIQRGHLTAAKVVVPTPDAMAKFHRIVAPLFEQKIQNAVQAKTLARLRDALLPKLIAGELRVPDAERIMEIADD
jgi:type I restriction enzyme S subunit